MSFKTLSDKAAFQRRWRKKNPHATLLIGAKSKAKRRGLEFNVEIDDIEWPTHCPVLGMELIYFSAESGRSGKRRTNKATLDRRDNSKGYVKGNVVCISHRANRIKSDATPAELAAITAYAAGGLNGTAQPLNGGRHDSSSEGALAGQGSTVSV